MSVSIEMIKGITGGDKLMCRDPLCEEQHSHQINYVCDLDDLHNDMTKRIKIILMKDDEEPKHLVRNSFWRRSKL
jgi:hypothetical protein